MPVLKPVIYMKIAGTPFHWGTSPGNANTPIISFSYKDTDGTDANDKKKKGKRDELEFTFLDYNPETNSYLSDDKLFTVGNTVVFEFGFEGPNQIQQSKLSGKKLMRIVNVTTSFSDDNEICTVTCHDRSADANTETKNVIRPLTFAKVKNKEDLVVGFREVINEIAKEEKLNFVFTDKKLNERTQKGGWQQQNETNMQFLQRIASEFGMNVYVERHDLFFESIKPKVKEKLWGRFYRGQDSNFLNSPKRQALMISFEPKVDLERTISEATSADVDTAKNKTTEWETTNTPEKVQDIDKGSGQNKGEPRIVNLNSNPPPTPKQAAATKAAKAKVQSNKTPVDDAAAQSKTEGEEQNANDSGITASAKLVGHPQIKAKTTIYVDGRVSRRWKQFRWYIESCTHSIDSSGYFVTVDMKAPVDTGEEADPNKADTSANQKNNAGEERQGIDLGSGENKGNVYYESLDNKNPQTKQTPEPAKGKKQ